MKPLPASHHRHRFLVEIVRHAVGLYHLFSLSLRDAEAERGIVVSYETVGRWKFGASFADRLRRHRPRPGDKWHLDEVFIRIEGVQHDLWRSVAIRMALCWTFLFSLRRDANAAKRFFFKRSLTGFSLALGTDRIPSPDGRLNGKANGHRPGEWSVFWAIMPRRACHGGQLVPTQREKLVDLGLDIRRCQFRQAEILFPAISICPPSRSATNATQAGQKLIIRLFQWVAVVYEANRLKTPGFLSVSFGLLGTGTPDSALGSASA
jgi:hypothetical protein